MKLFVRYKIGEGIDEHEYKDLHLPHHCSFIPTQLVWPQAKIGANSNMAEMDLEWKL
jgi:hypothetical protein